MLSGGGAGVGLHEDTGEIPPYRRPQDVAATHRRPRRHIDWASWLAGALVATAAAPWVVWALLHVLG